MTITKGERTRKRIVAAAAPLFNQRGYVGSSMSELMAATGLEKGGIYRHFSNKDELALEAFDHTLEMQRERIRSALEGKETVVERITALARGIAGAVEKTAVPGGCPLLNTAIESDDGNTPAHRALRKRTRQAMRDTINYARGIVQAGIEAGELPGTVDASAEAESLVGVVEGGLMLSKLYEDPHYVRQAVDRIYNHFKRLASTRRRAPTKR